MPNNLPLRFRRRVLAQGDHQVPKDCQAWPKLGRFSCRPEPGRLPRGSAPRKPGQRLPPQVPRRPGRPQRPPSPPAPTSRARPRARRRGRRRDPPGRLPPRPAARAPSAPASPPPRGRRPEPRRLGPWTATAQRQPWRHDAPRRPRPLRGAPGQKATEEKAAGALRGGSPLPNASGPHRFRPMLGATSAKVGPTCAEFDVRPGVDGQDPDPSPSRKRHQLRDRCLGRPLVFCGSPPPRAAFLRPRATGGPRRRSARAQGDTTNSIGSTTLRWFAGVRRRSREAKNRGERHCIWEGPAKGLHPMFIPPRLPKARGDPAPPSLRELTQRQRASTA